MPDSIERTIYKLELDDSAYIKGIESATASTKKLSQAQEESSRRLQENEDQLKKQAEQVEKARKELEAYTGTDKARKKQLEDTFQTEKKAYDTIVQLVGNVRKGYESAKKAADDFNNTAAKASTLGPGKIPGAAPIVPPIVQPPIQLQDFNLKEILSSTTIEFDKLREAIDAAEKELGQLNSESEEFKQLAPIVEQGKQVMQAFDNATKAAANSQGSIRERLRQGREALVQLEQAGLGATKQYFELEKQVARLTDEFQDQQQRIRILASDTKLLDFGKAGITAATSAFQSFTAIQILAGDQSEALQKKTMQLFAAMQLLQSIEQLSNLTRREGVLATLAQSGAQAVYTGVVGASTGALKTFRIALLATGIGAAVVVIGLLVKKYLEHKEAVEKARKEQKLFNDIVSEAAKSVADDVARLEVFRNKLNDTNLSQKERVAVAKEYNKTADEANKIDTKQIDNLTLINQKIAEQNKLLFARAVAIAATAKLNEAANEFVEAQLKLNIDLEKSGKTEQELIDKGNAAFQRRSEIIIEQGKVLDNFSQKQTQFAEKNFKTQQKQEIFLTEEEKRILGLISSRNAAQRKLQELTAQLSSLITVPGLVKPEGGKETKDIENVFIQERDRLLAQIAELRRGEIDGVKKINDEFAAKLQVEQNRIAAIPKGKLTGDQRKQLLDLAGIANKLELDRALAEFNKKILDARKKLNDDLADLQEKNTLAQLNLIQDEFKRRAALIDFNEKKELEDSKRNTDDRLAALELDKLLLGEQVYQDAKKEIINSGEQAALLILQKFAQQRQDLAADSFRKILDAYQTAISTADLIRDEGIAQQIRNVSDRFLSGKISYEKFQQEITSIQRAGEAIRRNATLQTQRNELAELDRHLNAIVDKTSKEYQDLLKLRNDLRDKIATGEKEDAIKDVEDKNVEDPRIKRIVAITEATGQLADSVIGFWQKANEAETKALDRSIALQERRVDAARRIAERGNAEYLKSEEDRLNELQVKRENAARRQLAIDAALQASQLLVAITGAIAKIATPGIGIAETIGAIAVIVGSLATGYGLVKSLQGNQPKLAKGDPYVQRGKHPAGVDTIPAWLNEGEAVIPTETNKKYHPTVRAIYEHSIPPEDINRFVKNYHSIKSVPQPNYERIKNATELHIDGSGKMAVLISEQNKKLDENNELLRDVQRALKGIGVSATIDKNGFALSMMEVQEQMRIDKRT